MEFPEPTIDTDREARELGLLGDVDLKALLAQAWEEGRWSPSGPCRNPYGQPAEMPQAALVGMGSDRYPGMRYGHLCSQVRAALALLDKEKHPDRVLLVKLLRQGLPDIPTPENPGGHEQADPEVSSDASLRAAAVAALAWIENMAPTVRRTALASQLRDALGGKAP